MTKHCIICHSREHTKKNCPYKAMPDYPSLSDILERITEAEDE